MLDEKASMRELLSSVAVASDVIDYPESPDSL